MTDTVRTERRIEPLLTVVDLLVDRGEKDLALDLLAQTITRMESADPVEDENRRLALAEVRRRLEEEYRRTLKRPGSGASLGHFVLRLALGTVVVSAIVGLFAAAGVVTVMRNSDRLYTPLAIKVYESMANAPQALSHRMDTIQRLRLKGFLSQNPYAHWRISEIKEARGDLVGALEEMRLAEALYQTAGVAPPDEYTLRIADLQRRVSAATP